MDPATIKTGIFLWKLAEPITRIKRALNKRRARKGKPLLEINQEDDVKAVKGALKSKMVWLGMLQEVWAVVQMYLNGGDVTTEVLATAVAGALTVVLRAVTNKPLSAK